MALIQDNDRKFLIDKFSKELINPVKVVLVTGKKGISQITQYNEEYLEVIQQILEEVKELSDKIELEVIEFNSDNPFIKEHNVEFLPFVAILGAKNSKVYFSGIPAGHEFTTIIEDIVDVSREETKLSKLAKEEISKIKKPVNIKVFVTPTCPYCPRAVRLAHQAAMENSLIRAEMIEANEFPELSQKYNVYGVPKTIINDSVEFEGAVPENMFLEYLRNATAEN